MSAWTEERIEALRKFIAEGDSYSMIAGKLNTLQGAELSRLAVLGKAHRLGLSSQNRSGPKQRSIKVVAAPRRAAVPVARTREMAVRVDDPQTDHAPHCQHKTIMELRDADCKWPIGDPLDRDHFRYCGAPRGSSPRPYCDFHASAAVEPGRYLRSFIQTPAR